MALLRLTPSGLLAFGRRIPCTIGRGGIVTAAQKREGDGATPSGDLRILGCLYRPDRMQRPVPWAEPILPGDLWSDASAAPDYNSHVRVPYTASHEALRRADPLYDLVLITDWNYPNAQPGRGSAIFIHRWRRLGAPTAGCLAMAPQNLMWLVQRLIPGDRLRIPEPPAGRLNRRYHSGI